MNKPNWWFREQNRFLSGQYACPPWRACPTCRSSIPGVPFERLPDIDLHAVHISITNPKLVAYTKTHEHGERDIQTPLKPGKYIQTYYPSLHPEQVGFYASLLGLAATQKNDELRFAYDADDIEWVYTNGPPSCMSHSTEKFQSGGIHPTRTYAAGDLAVAYVINTQKGTPAARSVVWPKKHRYSRIYGDAGAYSTRLEILLNEAGYSPGTIEGARLALLKPPSSEHLYIVPYVDGCSHTREENGFLILDMNGNIPATNQTGVSSLPLRYCETCRSSFVQDRAGMGLRGRLCPSCRTRQIVVCPQHNDEVLRTTIVTVFLQDDTTIEICRECANAAYAQCRSCNRLWEPSVLVADAESRMVCHTCREDRTLYAGNCIRCCRPVNVHSRGRSRKTVVCRQCSQSMAYEKTMKIKGIQLRPDMLALAQENGIDPFECQSAYDQVLIAIGNPATVTA